MKYQFLHESYHTYDNQIQKLIRKYKGIYNQEAKKKGYTLKLEIMISKNTEYKKEVLNKLTFEDRHAFIYYDDYRNLCQVILIDKRLEELSTKDNFIEILDRILMKAILKALQIAREHKNSKGSIFNFGPFKSATTTHMMDYAARLGRNDEKLDYKLGEEYYLFDYKPETLHEAFLSLILK